MSFTFCPTYAKAEYEDGRLKDLTDKQLVIENLRIRCQINDVFDGDDVVIAVPEIKTFGSSGADIRATCFFKPGDDEPQKSFKLEPGKMVIVGTGIHVELPVNLELQVRGRSGLAFKHGISIVHGVGTIDSDYRGEIKVILVNHGEKLVTLNRGDRVAQMILGIVIPAKYMLVETLSETERGSNGFGSTGK